ncbi:hypothetical protein HRbin21_00803 [bacterium HR21]|nr:hypothetical protein HRbin21_00803 [bacterium HR21]
MARGGGPGKVYFVLYLAVVLELLLIIVERDDAEEHLLKKQKESMRIVQSILSQLQVGTGTEGISTRPKDEITIAEGYLQTGTGTQIRQDRYYEVEVGVTDVTGMTPPGELEPEEAAQQLQTLIRLANVQELDYQIFYHPSPNPDQAPPFPSDDTLRRLPWDRFMEGQPIGPEVDGAPWRLLVMRRLELDQEKTRDYQTPVYKPFTIAIGDLKRYAPPDAVARDSIFWYDHKRTLDRAQQNGGRIKKRIFAVRFQPPPQPGWYKLRFASRTNRILGIQGDKPLELTGEETVNIGTVQIKVKDLQLVKRELEYELSAYNLPSADDLIAGKIDAEAFLTQLRSSIEYVRQEFPEKAPEITSKLELYGYIARLLAPGQSAGFEQNRSSIAIDIRVIKPAVPPPADPKIFLAQEEFYSFDKAQRTVIPFVAGPISPGGKTPTVTVQPSVAFRLADLGPEQVAGTPAAGAATNHKFEIQITEPVPAGEYTVRITHANIAGKQTTAETRLVVFPSRLNNAEDIDAALQQFCYYGYSFQVTAEPPSAGKIPAAQFRTSIAVGGGDQQPVVPGLQAQRDIPASASTVTVRVAWQNPYTGEQVTLYERSGTPQQRYPQIAVSNVKVDPTINPRNPEILVTGIMILPPFIDVGRQASPEDIKDVRVQITRADIPNYKPSATIQRSGATTYDVRIRLDGPIPVRRGRLDGTVSLLITAKVRNPINGVESREGRAVIQNIPVSY